ncbi:MAG TPA: DoxX family membrane protein [Gaiellales bacterium]|nr:DoxX family membrane protein [Gaiellales bacterium]
MAATLTSRERTFRVALGLFLAFVAYNVGLTGHGSLEPIVLAWGAAVLALVALVSAAVATTGPLAMFGMNADWSLGYLAGRLFVGWEFLYAGWLKASDGWYTQSTGTNEVKGVLTGAISQSHASAQVPFPAVSHWFAWTADNVFIPRADLIGYLVVTGELAVGIGLILGLFLRLSSFFGVTLNALFMFAGALGAGLGLEMIIPGMLVLLGAATAIHAVSVDRYLLPRLHGLEGRLRIPRPHIPAH